MPSYIISLDLNVSKKNALSGLEKKNPRVKKQHPERLEFENLIFISEKRPQTKMGQLPKSEGAKVGSSLSGTVDGDSGPALEVTNQN